MGRISSSVTEMKSTYDIIVIGSGYGSGVTASRIARAGKKVCVLDRGKEFLPGEFPDTPSEEETRLLPINVNFKRFKSDMSHVGVPQEPCILCGDYVTGCNYASKLVVRSCSFS